MSVCADYISSKNSSGIRVGGNTTFQGQTLFVGNATCAGTMDFSGAVVYSGGQQITGDTTSTGTSNFDGNATFGGTVAFDNDATHFGAEVFASTAAFETDVTHAGDDLFEGDNTFTGTTTFVGDVYGSTTSPGDDLMLTTKGYVDSVQGGRPPEYYGAVGDGLTDDTAAVQSCINNGGSILFGRGQIYRITDRLSVPANTDIDMNDSQITTNNGIDPSVYLNVDGTFIVATVGMWVVNQSNVKIRNGTLNQIHNALFMRDVHNIVLDNMKFTTVGSGINQTTSSQTSSNISITNCTIANVRAWSIYLNTVDNVNISNCIFTNWGVWCLNFGAKVNMLTMSNVDMKYDKTYATWPVPGEADPGNPGQYRLTVNWLNKLYTNSFAYADGGLDKVEHYGYMTGVTNSKIVNCNFSTPNAPVVATKFTSGWSNVSVEHCSFEQVYNALPNTTPGDPSVLYYSTIQFRDCEIDSLRFAIYANADFDHSYTGCTISGAVTMAGSPPTAPIYLGCNIRFYECEFQMTGSARFSMDNQFDGWIVFKGCRFVAPLITDHAFQYAAYCPSTYGTQYFSGAHLLFDACEFITIGTTVYCLYISNTGTEVIRYGSFEVRNCKMLTGRVCVNNVAENLVISECSIDNGTTAVGGTTTTPVYSNCKIKTNPPTFVTGTVDQQYGNNSLTVAPLYANATMSAKYDTVQSADYCANALFKTPIATTGYAIISNGMLFFNSTGFVAYAADSTTDGGNYMAVKMKIKPTWNGTPSNTGYGNIGLFSAGSIADSYNRIQLYIDNLGYVHLVVTRKDPGGIIIAAVFGLWNTVVAGTIYELEFNMDVSGGATKSFLLIDGVVLGTPLTPSDNWFNRTAGTMFQIGSDLQNRTGMQSYFSVGDLVIYNTPNHGTAGYAPGYSLPSGSNCGITYLNQYVRGLVVGNSAEINNTGVLRVYNTMDSTSTTTGAVSFSGGASVGKALYVGGALTVVGTMGNSYATLSGLATGALAGTSTTITGYCYLMNNIYHVFIDGFKGTAATTDTVDTAAGFLPVAFRPPGTSVIYNSVMVYSNGAGALGTLTLLADGSISVGLGLGGDFTQAQTCGMYPYVSTFSALTPTL
jgi:hypothetical protein